MRRFAVYAFVVLNIVLAIGLFAGKAQSQRMFMMSGMFNCCQYDQGEEGYCCDSCCWLPAH